MIAPVFGPLSNSKQIVLFLTSIIIVGFGQPAWNWLLSMIAAGIGYAFFFRVLLCHSSAKKRFWLGTCFFTLVQMIQISWMVSHPYFYIYGVWTLFSFLMGLQFGVLALFITPQQLHNPFRILALAGLWTLFEWSRLYFLSGYTFNPAGIALSANLHSLQMASFWGIFGLSFWVMFVNLLAIRSWGYELARAPTMFWFCMLMVPYVYGYIHLQIHRPAMEEHHIKAEDPYTVVLVQTGFPIEEALGLENKNMLLFVMDEWKQILNITANHRGQSIDLIVLPEFVVPYGTWTSIYPYEKIRKIFEETLGEDSLKDLPPLAPPFAKFENNQWFVNNAYLLQGIANTFDADVVSGLEDAEPKGKRVEYYSSAMHFKPQQATEEMIAMGYLHFPVNRYEKRILVPMGEYIPFSFLEELAKDYGVFGSFTPGKEAKVFEHSKMRFSPSICYEETYGDLMRESRLKGAEILVNLTSDAWFPNSRLPLQHFYHSRLRTVENGVPLVRACNTGITSGVDSLGQVIAVLGETPHEQEWSSDSIRFEVPTYTYSTFYSRVGDGFILGISLLLVTLALRYRKINV